MHVDYTLYAAQLQRQPTFQIPFALYGWSI